MNGCGPLSLTPAPPNGTCRDALPATADSKLASPRQPPLHLCLGGHVAEAAAPGKWRAGKQKGTNRVIG
jgi:hypothetical protein